ncbi:MAG: hypothetical protein IT160_18250 [Bryobacterales bacterium]|nr:hypothetical protein [Bryobacterales bacterium]
MISQLLASIIMAAAAYGAPANVLRAGARSVDITPQSLPIITSGNFLATRAGKLDGALHARAVALDDGSGGMVISVVDSLMMPRELIDRIKATASARTGIPAPRMLISATHTHSAPPVMGALGTDNNSEYSAFVEARVVEAIEGAVKNLAPATAGWTVVNVPEHTNSRRWILRPDKMRKDPFGDLNIRAQMHPGYQNPDFVGPSGPIDPALSLLSFRSPEGRPIALIANYSMHYVGAASETVSPDYYGFFAQNVQNLIGRRDGGPPFVAIMSQGTSGDLHWMDYSRPRKDMNIALYAETMAKIVAQAYGAISYRGSTRIAMAETRLRLKRRTPNSERLAWAKRIYAGMAGAPPRNQQEVYAREQVLIDAEPERELVLQALRIGDLGIAAIPNEVFAITGLKIKAQSPLRPTFTIELANGAEGYIPPPAQHKLGGYTTWPARTAGLEIDAEPKVAEAALKLLERVSGQPRRPVVDTHGAYAKTILGAKPAAYWRLNEFHGPTAADATGHGNAATFQDGIAFYLEGPPSKAFSGEQINRSPHLAGGLISANIPGTRDRYSVEMWFMNALPHNARACTGYLFSSGADRVAIGGTQFAPGRLVFTSGGTQLQGTTEIALKTWNHVLFVRNRDRVTIYLNGNEQPEITGIAAGNGDASLLIGGSEEGPANFEGKIDEVAVYRRALSAGAASGHFAVAR